VSTVTVDTCSEGNGNYNNSCYNKVMMRTRLTGVEPYAKSHIYS